MGGCWRPCQESGAGWFHGRVTTPSGWQRRDPPSLPCSVSGVGPRGRLTLGTCPSPTQTSPAQHPDQRESRQPRDGPDDVRSDNGTEDAEPEPVRAHVIELTDHVKAYRWPKGLRLVGEDDHQVLALDRQQSSRSRDTSKPTSHLSHSRSSLLTGSGSTSSHPGVAGSRCRWNLWHIPGVIARHSPNTGAHRHPHRDHPPTHPHHLTPN